MNIKNQIDLNAWTLAEDLKELSVTLASACKEKEAGSIDEQDFFLTFRRELDYLSHLVRKNRVFLDKNLWSDKVKTK